MFMTTARPCARSVQQCVHTGFVPRYTSYMGEHLAHSSPVRDSPTHESDPVYSYEGRWPVPHQNGSHARSTARRLRRGQRTEHTTPYSLPSGERLREEVAQKKARACAASKPPDDEPHRFVAAVVGGSGNGRNAPANRARTGQHCGVLTHTRRKGSTSKEKRMRSRNCSATAGGARADLKRTKPSSRLVGTKEGRGPRR